MDQEPQESYCRDKETNGSQRLDQTRSCGFEGQVTGNPEKLNKSLKKRHIGSNLWKKGARQPLQ